MALHFDLHLHTSRHSKCSRIPAEKLIDRAVSAGLDGLVITEHHYQWPEDELQALVDASDHPGFLLLAAFEYTSALGDILIYGLQPTDVAAFTPGKPPEDAMARAGDLGAVCIAAHPTRAGLGFDERIFTLGFDAIEVRSVNLQEHEQHLAIRIAEQAGVPQVTNSDAHRIQDVAAYANAFDLPISTMADLCNGIRGGLFHPGV